jgi:hypothetical protein
MAADFAGQRIYPAQSRRLRIDSTARTNSVSSRPGVGRSAGGGFFVEDGTPQARVSSAEPVVGTAGLDAILALQAVEDPLFARKKAVRRGNQLLDTLESIKADLLLGQVSEGRLNQLMVLIGQAREQSVRGLDALLDDIELRARVELAKFGRYPGQR